MNAFQLIRADKFGGLQAIADGAQAWRYLAFTVAFTGRTTTPSRTFLSYLQPHAPGAVR